MGSLFLFMTRISRSGWSLTELMVAIAVVALLVTLIFPAYTFVKAKMEFAGCVSNLKALHAGLSTYTQDHGMVWPQYPHDIRDTGDEEGEDKLSVWWFETLKPYGIPRKTWLCPADRDGHEQDNENTEHLMASYGVTLFDEMPNSAYRWLQPWVVESGQNHGKSQGPNVIMPDGQVRQGVGIEMVAPVQQ
jgi:prepilin-type N-terminal cleavage/methylation domain-containing protein